MVAFDAVGPSSSGQLVTSASAFSWTHTAGTGGGTVLVWLTVGLNGGGANGALGSYASVTYGGTAMTLLGSVAAGGINFGGIFLYGLASGGANGANTVQVGAYTPPSGAGFVQSIGVSESFTGAGALGTAVTASGNAATGSAVVTGTASGSVVAGGACDGTGAEATTAGTQRWKLDNSSSTIGNTVGATAGSSGGTVTLTWTWTLDAWASIGVEVKSGAIAKSDSDSARAAENQSLPGRPSDNDASSAADASGLTASLSSADSSAAADAGTTSRYITGLSGTTSSDYFTDNTGRPRWMFCDSVWTLIYAAGRSGAQTWQQDIDQVVSTRASQGYTAIQTNLLPNNEYAALNGKTWDGISPFNTGTDPSSGLNGTYWARADYLVSSLAKHGMAWFANLFFGEDAQAGGVAGSWTAAQQTAYGNAVASRYLGTANLVWMINDDGVAGSSTLSNILTGVRNAGDTRFISTENPQETTSRFGLKLNDVQTFGTASAQYNWVYTYAPSYGGVEYAFAEASPIPVIRGDGYYFGTIGGTDDKVSREQFWWCISSASRGYSWGMFDGGWGAFAAGWASNLTAAGEETGTAGDFNNRVFPAATTFLTGLPNWQKLKADSANAFLTAGRGTRAPYQTEGVQNQYNGSTPDTYVSGSYAADGSIAMVYFSRGATSTVTLATGTKMAANYIASWVDPANCAVTAATPGTTFTRPAGANSAGDHDWLLLLQAPPSDGDSAAASESQSVSAIGGPSPGTDASLAADGGEHVTATLSSADTGHGTDGGEGGTGAFSPHDADASSAADASGLTAHLSTAPGAADASAGADGGESIGGPGTSKHDADSVHGEDSGFAYPSAADSCAAADGGETIAPPPQAETSAAADQELRAWPSDTDSAAAVTEGYGAWPHDTEACAAAEAWRQVWTWSDTDSSAAADTEREQVEVFSYQPLFRWTGGGFAVVWHASDGAGGYTGVMVWRGPLPDARVYRLTAELAAAREVRAVADSDSCRSGDAEGPPGVSVSITVRRALAVAAWAG